MNALQKIVNDEISTALIFEDDIDWDVTIKAQLKQFARGVRALQDTSVSSFSPYGENWDVLWPGGCGAGTKPSSRVYMIPNDTTVPPRSRHFPSEIIKPVFAEWEGMENARFVFNDADVPCSLAYAVTFESARKILTKWSLEPNSQPFDNDLRELCNPTNSHGTSLRCLAPYPLLFNSYRKEGPDFQNSDIHNDGDFWHEAFTNGITYSTMLNSKRLGNGAKTALAQYPEVRPQLLEFEGLELPQGNLTSWNLRLYQPE
ncbi:uncharacterized protein PFLUO_LOCUS7075 [Penicillium psychrofluorescens]|uniref:uncharacterized protein n=1 Tax=Penicillium psychrofluorescens TaxID=3158075 RepID=UPI003CCCA705